MSDKKNNETKKSGLRGIFRRKDSRESKAPSSETPKPANNAQTKPEEQSQRPPARRMYTPRYAERDMILSVPVEDRPDLVAKAKENRLKRVCSDIGFSTNNSSRASSSHVRSASMNLNTLSQHPKLQMSRYAAMDLAMPGSSGSSVRSLAMQRHSAMPAASNQPSINAREQQWKGLSYNGPASLGHRPRPRTTQSMANIPHMIPESQIERVDHAYKHMNASEDSEHADVENSSRSSTPSSVYMPESHRRPMPAPARQRSYFGHNAPLPDLRTKKEEENLNNAGKGKEPARGWNGNQGRTSQMYNQPSQQASYESVSSDYVISTKPLRASQTAPARIIPPPPPPSNYDSSVTNSPKISAQDSRAPSLTESDSNGTDRSYSDNNESYRTNSTSTILTAHTDADDVKTEKAVKLDNESDRSAKTKLQSEHDGSELKHVETVKAAEVSLESW